MSEETAQDTPAVEESTPAQATKIKIGKVREFMACTVKMRGCKAPQMGNVFPVDHHTGTLVKPFALACSNCLTKMQDEGQWVIPN